MTCSSCGNALAQDAHFCPRCGAPIAARPFPPQPQPVYAGVPVYSTRVVRHVQIAGILWLIYAVERTLSKIAGLMFLHGLFGRHFEQNQLESLGQHNARNGMAGGCRFSARRIGAQLAHGIRIADQAALGTHHGHCYQHPRAVSSHPWHRAGYLYALGLGAGGQRHRIRRYHQHCSTHIAHRLADRRAADVP